MHVGVKEPVAQRVVQEQLDQPFGQGMAVVAGGGDGVDGPGDELDLLLDGEQGLLVLQPVPRAHLDQLHV